ncbi:biotin--[acetyl-CoA-carboxylase] ligase [Chryseolinea sp. T2]|uniref:biotin--[acetyl-CoA-carboxylase] ligase n=1 Tax=Chryseolinea sp. T2 TaxID=3129255 RepID=UPI003077FAC0
MGKEVVYMPECHSTNSFALDRCQQLPPPSEGTIIITNNQYAGRGQRGNDWKASPGENLTFSIILKPGFLALSQQFLLNVCSALAVADFLSAEGCNDVSVKWPNDVYIGKKKVCGILVESQIRGNQLIWSIMGIGLNINQQSFPISSATSLSLETNRPYILDDCLSNLVPFVEARYLQARQGHENTLVSQYQSRLYWANETHLFESAGRGLFKGVISGVDSTGKLKIQIGGETAAFGTKEIAFVE